jgi:hypothetical protein
MQHLIKRERVQVDGSAAGTRTARTGSVAAPGVTPARARCVRVDGRVRAIELACRCGATSVVELEYDEPAAGEVRP